MKQYTLLLILLSNLSFAFAQKAQTDSVTLSGNICDAFTRQALAEGMKARVALLHKDSTLVLSTTTYDEKANGRPRITSYALRVAKENDNDFLVHVDADGYEPRVVPVKIRWRKGYPVVFAPEIYVRRKPMREHQLDEVVVTATKIKFYNNGDTLVYNADAFQLQEGSMLDALIAQLPGAQLKPDGKITVNGQFVESLLLNGRDFFKSDNTVLLDNLPAYMVNNIQVYKKQDERYEGVDFKSKIDEGTLVMDIKLKRQYDVWWLANAEGGHGSDDRYLGRLFAMRNTRNSNITLFGNINNVNARRQPDGNGDWGDFDPSGGLTSTKQAGLSYNVNDKYGKFRIGGEAQIEYNDNVLSSAGTSSDFLPGGDTYSMQKRYSKTIDFAVSTAHFFNMSVGKNFRYNIAPKFNYKKTDTESSYLNGTFDRLPSADYQATLDSLASPFWTKNIVNIIRRNMEQATGSGHLTTARIPVWFRGSIPGISKHQFMLEAEANVYDQKQDIFNRFTYNYYENTLLQTDFRNRFDNPAQTDFSFKTTLTHLWEWNFYINMKTSYSFNRKYSDGDQMHYRLDKLEESGNTSLGWLPDERRLADVLDADNSYKSTLRLYQHTVKIDWSFNKFKKDKQRRPISGWTVFLRPSLTFENGRYRLCNTPDAQMVKKSYVLPQFSLFAIRQILNGVNYVSIRANHNTYSPSLTNLVNKTFGYDPLNITLGNPNLKKRSTTGLNLTLGLGTENKQQLTVTLAWETSHNAIGSKNIYDKSTGVSTTQMVNVNGNWNSGVTVNYWLALDKKQRFTFSSNGYVQYLNYENLIGTSHDAPLSQSSTHKLIVCDELRLDYRYKKTNAGLFCTIDYNNVTSSRPDFSDLSTLSLIYGAKAVMDLPLGFQVATDLAMYSRSGYVSSAMNRNDLVWNARVSKSFMKRKLTLMLDAWDILGNISNVDAGNNATCRWEYYTNVIPRYAMARLVYKFARQPKKTK